jgi:hypothetical protein
MWLRLLRWFERLKFWIRWIVAPAGVVGATTTFIDLFNGLIEWNGFIGYISNYWSQNISSKFDQLFSHTFALLNLPPPSPWLSQYLTLGLLFYLCGSRAYDYLVIIFKNNSEKIKLLKILINSSRDLSIRLVEIPLALIFWPLFLIFCIYMLVRSAYRIQKKKRDAKKKAKAKLGAGSRIVAQPRDGPVDLSVVAISVAFVIVTASLLNKRGNVDEEIILAYSLTLMPFVLFTILFGLNYVV